MSELLEYLILGPIIFGLILYFLNYRWFRMYADFVLGFIILALAAVSALVKLLPTMVAGLVKGVVILLVGILETAIYLLTSVVPFVGEKAAPLHGYLDEKLHSSGVIDRISVIREMMVDIVAKHDDRSLQFESKEEYQDELRRVRRDAEIKLDRGETTISMSLGFALLLAQLLDAQLTQISFHRITASTTIEILLLLLAISIIYRTSVLNYLTYPTEIEFDSIEKFDVALAYQKGVCFTNVVQVLMPVMIVSFALLNTDRGLIKDVLEKKYAEGRGIIDWGPYAWKRVGDKD